VPLLVTERKSSFCIGQEHEVSGFFDLSAQDIDWRVLLTLLQFRGSVTILVNVAELLRVRNRIMKDSSNCGPCGGENVNYGVSCNQFGKQEPSTTGGNGEFAKNEGVGNR
jgi:hypothetical protein